MKKKNLHIVPAKGWGVKREGRKKNSSIALTKGEAIKMGKVIAMKEKLELVIHNEDGTISDSDSYGNDPFPERDRKH